MRRSEPRWSPPRCAPPRYHYVHGLEVSSAAAIAAYFVELSRRMDGLASGTFCCFDAFSRVDLRIDFVFPGSVSL